jgi:hypothetical protein
MIGGILSDMASRTLIVATLVGASVAVPYFSSQSKTAKPGVNGAPASVPSYGQQATGTMSRLPGLGAASPYGAAAPKSPMVSAMPIAMSGARLNGAQFTSIDQVIRFDISKEWVYQNWDRKSTGATDVGLFSVRVPLVMTPQIYALAGSLTYFFNQAGQVEHISFRGRTGDSAQLVQLLTSRYQLQPVSAQTGEQVFQLQGEGGIQSELRTHPEPVVYMNSANQSVAVELELARPGSTRLLPPRPTGFEGLQAAQAQQAAAAAQAQAEAAAAAQKSGATAESAGSSYLNKVRYATPEEQSQVNWQRWPN